MLERSGKRIVPFDQCLQVVSIRERRLKINIAVENAWSLFWNAVEWANGWVKAWGIGLHASE